MQDAMDAAARSAEQTGGLGRPGQPLSRRSPLYVGMAGAVGVAIIYGLVQLLVSVRSVLVLIGLALFIAVGLDPAVTWLTRRGLRRGAAVTVVLACVIAAAGGFLAAAIPTLTHQAGTLAHDAPQYLRMLQSRSSEIGRLNERFHIERRLSSFLGQASLVSRVVKAGKLVFTVASSLIILAVLTTYFLAALPKIRLFAYRLVPDSRRPRVILIGDEILSKVGRYVLGNFATSLIAGAGTYAWMFALGIPYPFLLGVSVAVLDLIPVIGSTVGGAIVSLTALTVSLPVALATLGFYIAYRLAEDYLIVPRIIGRAVQVPAVVSVVAVLIGGVLLGIVGALVAIPAAAAVSLLLREITFPRLDRH